MLEIIINLKNMMYGLGGIQGFGGSFLSLAPLFILLMVWSIFWKGLALWHSGKRGQGWWFVILLVVNTVGILEIIYLFAVLKLKSHDLFLHRPSSTPPQTPQM